MSKDHEVRVDGGKFTFICPANHPSVRVIDRIEPEPWVYFVDKALAVLAMMRGLDAARVVVQAVRWHLENKQIPIGIANALDLHDRLVSDREPPSAWCGAPPDRAAESTVEDRPRLTDNEMVMAHQALNEAGRAGQLIRFAALEKLIAFYKRSTTP